MNIETMDPNNPIIKLCVKGTQAEYQGKTDKAREIYQDAWNSARDDFEACIAAHYMAQMEEDPARRLNWNLIALEKANASENENVGRFYPSLYLNLGQSFDAFGKTKEAKKYYDLAASLGAIHQAGS